VGPVRLGKNKFVFQAPCPNAKLIPAKDILDVTVILLICSYQGKEFIRVGYYVSNYYIDPQLAARPPAVPVISKLYRHILADKPRVTRLDIPWDNDYVIPSPGPFDYLIDRKVGDYREVAPKEEDHALDDDESMDIEEDLDLEQDVGSYAPASSFFQPLRRSTPSAGSSAMKSRKPQSHGSVPGQDGAMRL